MISRKTERCILHKQVSKLKLSAWTVHNGRGKNYDDLHCYNCKRQCMNDETIEQKKTYYSSSYWIQCEQEVLPQFLMWWDVNARHIVHQVYSPAASDFLSINQKMTLSRHFTPHKLQERFTHNVSFTYRLLCPVLSYMMKAEKYVSPLAHTSCSCSPDNDLLN